MAMHAANERWMDRWRRWGGVALALGMALSVGVGQSAPAAADGSKRTASRLPTKEVAYVFGKLDGVLSDALMEVLRPAKWKGQTDGLVIMAGRRIHRLSSNTLAELLDVYAAGQPIVLTHGLPEDVERLHDLLGSAVPVTLREPYEHFELYGHADTEFGPKAFAMMPPVSAQPSDGHPRHPTDRLEDRLKRAEELPRWVELDVRQSSRTGGNPDPGAQTSDGEVLPIYADIQAWEVKQSFAVNYLWGTCNTKAIPSNTDYYRDSCQAVYEAYVDAWPVYSADNSTVPTDYFVLQLSGNLGPGSCYGWYDGRNHDNRLSAYWARQYEFTANVAPNVAACVNNPTGGPTCYWSFDDLSVGANNYNPPTADPDVTIQEGMSWSIGGSGTAGPKGNAVGFTAGASFTHSTSASYQALGTTAVVGDGAANQGQMQWSFDSWNFVSDSIQPGNNACGGPGLWGGAVAAPAIITNGTFSPQMTYVWEVSEDMRNTYGGDTLPVDVDLGVLLGWTYYPNAESQCNQFDGDYSFNNEQDAQSTNGDYEWSALSSSNPNPTGLPSLYFDVVCGVVAQYGTVPLGPSDAADQDNSIGNPGTPQLLSITANVPFADPTAP